MYSWRFSRIKDLVPADVVIDVVGGGDIDRFEKIADSMGISHRVNFYGHTTDLQKVTDIFSRSIACVSPGQAGLSVLSSFACGVCFVTSNNAVTGGEIENIVQLKTGVLYDGSVEHLASVMLFLSSNKGVSVQLGSAALEYYSENMSIDRLVGKMADRLLSGE